MKVFFSIAIIQLFIASILAASCTLVIHKVGGTITAEVNEGECHNLAKSTATRVINIEGESNPGTLAAYNGADCGGDEVKSGSSPLIFKYPVMVASIRVDKC
ncbi:hypothetical protein K501DRAFT_282302, partial [Backusella circina FSU 941]